MSLPQSLLSCSKPLIILTATLLLHQQLTSTLPSSIASAQYIDEAPYDQLYNTGFVGPYQQVQADSDSADSDFSKRNFQLYNRLDRLLSELDGIQTRLSALSYKRNVSPSPFSVLLPLPPMLTADFASTNTADDLDAESAAVNSADNQPPTRREEPEPNEEAPESEEQQGRVYNSRQQTNESEQEEEPEEQNTSVVHPTHNSKQNQGSGPSPHYKSPKSKHSFHKAASNFLHKMTGGRLGHNKDEFASHHAAVHKHSHNHSNKNSQTATTEDDE